MTSLHPRAWPAQEPPADFAERTALRVLEQRRRSLRLRRRALTGGAVAAVMIAGGAWGFARSARPREAMQSFPASTATLEVVSPAPKIEPPSVVPPALEPRAPVPLRHRKSEAYAPTAPPDAGRKVILPRCNCSPNEATICDCF
jgi:hypothetical protein